MAAGAEEVEVVHEEEEVEVAAAAVAWNGVEAIRICSCSSHRGAIRCSGFEGSSSLLAGSPLGACTCINFFHLLFGYLNNT